MPDGNASTAQKAADQTQQVASNTADRSMEVLGAAAGEAQHVAGAAREQMSHVAGEASAQVVRLWDDMKGQLHGQAQAQTEQLGDGLGRFAAQLRAVSEGRPEDSGPLRDLMSAGAERVEQLTDRIQRGGFDAVVTDIERFARRRPVAFLAGALTAGLVVGRLARGGRAAGARGGRGSTGGDAWPPSGTSLPSPWDELPSGGYLGDPIDGAALRPVPPPVEPGVPGLRADPYVDPSIEAPR